MRTCPGSSVLVKLVVAERESKVLRDYLHANSADTLFTAALARTELVRTVTGAGELARWATAAVDEAVGGGD
jgi:hypothetical protein